MTRNGQQHPPRPRIEIAQSSASAPETAAIAAAIEQFLRDTTPPPAPHAHRTNPWLRAALYENAGLDPSNANAWGDGEPWGR